MRPVMVQSRTNGENPMKLEKYFLNGASWRLA
jgi:hypothetical protein